MRALLDQDFKIRLRVEDEGGILVDANTSTDPLFELVSSAGVPVSGCSGAMHEAVGLYAWGVPALDSIDVYTGSFTWSMPNSSFTRRRTEKISVVRDRICPLWLYREDPELSDINALKLLRLSDVVDEWLDSALQFAPVETAFEQTFVVPRDASSLQIPSAKYVKSVTSVVYNGAEFTPTELEDIRIVDGRIERGYTGWGFLTGTLNQAPWSAGSRITVRGTHGPRPDWATGVPEDLQRCAVILGRYANRLSNYPERARQVVTDGAMISFSMPSPDRPTGLPEVDHAVSRYRVQSAV